MPSRTRRSLTTMALAAALLTGCRADPVTTVTTPATRPDTCRTWTRVSLPPAPISVSLPDLPCRADDTVGTPVGPCHVVRYRTTSPDADYDAGWLERPRTLLTAFAGPQRILREACAGTAATLRGTVTDSRALTVDNHPAREVRIRIDAEGEAPPRTAAARLVLLPDRIAHAIVVSRAGPLDDTTSTWFLASLTPTSDHDGSAPEPRTYSAGSTASAH
ncbi:MAG: hypothetical protein KDA21_03230 [Phycisphaerales bacterium]|nr:hypothetical protein [Phycisphaerales bacterium]